MDDQRWVKIRAPGLDGGYLVCGTAVPGARVSKRHGLLLPSAMLEVETKFKVLNIEFSNKFDRNPIESIETRLKKPRSIYEKMNRLGLPISVDAIEKNLNDIAGVRVICSFVDDIYKLADMLAVQDDIYVVQTKDLHQKPERERLSQSAYDCGRCRFFSPTKSGTCAWRCSCERLRWISGQVWNTNCATRRIFPPRRRTRLPNNCKTARRSSHGRTSRCTTFANRLKHPASKRA